MLNSVYLFFQQMRQFKKDRFFVLRFVLLFLLFGIAISGSANAQSGAGIFEFQNSTGYTTTPKHSKALTDAINFFSSLKVNSSKSSQLGSYDKGATAQRLREALNIPTGAEINKDVLINWLNKNVKEVHDDTQSVKLVRASDGDTIPFTANENITMSNVSSVSYYIVKGYPGYEFFVGNEVRTLRNPSEGILAIGPAFDQESSELTVLSTLFHEAKHSDCRLLDSAFSAGGNGDSQFAAALDLYKKNRGSQIQNCTYMHANCPAGHELAGYPACDGDKIGAYGTEALINEFMSVACSNCTTQQRMQFQALFFENKSRVLGWEKLFTDNSSSDNLFNDDEAEDKMTATTAPPAPHTPSAYAPTGAGADGLTDRQKLPVKDSQVSSQVNLILTDLLEMQLQLSINPSNKKLITGLRDFVKKIEAMPTRMQLHKLNSWELISKKRAKMAVDLAASIFALKELVNHTSISLNKAKKAQWLTLNEKILTKANQICQKFSAPDTGLWPAYLGEICEAQLH